MESGSRRRFLRVVAAGGLGGVAGCNQFNANPPDTETEAEPSDNEENKQTETGGISIEALQVDRFPPQVTQRVTTFTAPHFDSTGTLFGVPTSLTALVGLRNESGQEIEAGGLRFQWKVVGADDEVVEQFDTDITGPEGMLSPGAHAFRKQIRSKINSGALKPGTYSLQLEVVAEQGLLGGDTSVVATAASEFSVIPLSETPVVDAPVTDLDGDDTPETHIGNIKQMSLAETSPAIKFTKNTLDIITGLYTDETIPDLSPDKGKVNELAANTAKTALSSREDGQVSIYWANHATQEDAGVFGVWYDRAIVTAKIPDTVSIQDSGGADFVATDPEAGAHILTWVTTEVGNGIKAKPVNTFDPDDPSGKHTFSLVSSTATPQTVDIEYSLSLELGPLRGEPTSENAFGYQDEPVNEINSVYDYKQWQETPEDVYWASIGNSYESQKVTVPPEQVEAFADGFENGRYDGWELIWFENRGPGSGDNLFSATTNYWDVETENAIDGDYSMHMIAESYPAARATQQRVLVLDRNFEFSYKYYFENRSLGGPRIHLWDREETGSAGGDRLTPGTWGPHLGSAVRPYDGDNPEFRLFGESTVVDDGTFSPGTTHTVRVVRNNDTITGYHDGEEMVSVDAQNITTDLSKRYKLLIVSGTDSGEETDMWMDSFRLEIASGDSEG